MGLSAAQITEIRASYGADSSLPVRYLHAITNFLTGDLGYSVQAGVPVSQQLETNLPTTAELSALGFLGAVFAGRCGRLRRLADLQQDEGDGERRP